MSEINSLTIFYRSFLRKFNIPIGLPILITFVAGPGFPLLLILIKYVPPVIGLPETLRPSHLTVWAPMVPSACRILISWPYASNISIFTFFEGLATE